MYTFQMLQADSTAIDEGVKSGVGVFSRVGIFSRDYGIGNRNGTIENFCHQVRHQTYIIMSEYRASQPELRLGHAAKLPKVVKGQSVCGTIMVCVHNSIEV